MGNSLAYTLRSLFSKQSIGGTVLVIASIIALLLANSPYQQFYSYLIDTQLAVSLNGASLSKPLLLWVNDGLMALFFLLVGLELKREFLVGELKEFEHVMLPGLGALGGMVVPALIYFALNHDNASGLQGWAIPVATDIAFALGVLSLLGDRVPLALKVFLASLAIFDDIGAVIIIAVFYTSDISLVALAISGCCIAALFACNRFGVPYRRVYLIIGLVMWVALLKSGVHATLAGVLLAMFVPIAVPGKEKRSPLRNLEHDLMPIVTFVILPIFAFCNAGVSLAGVGIAQLTHPVTLGIALGLALGKPIGVFAFCWVGVRFGFAKLPESIDWGKLFGVALLCGIGFTMSLFIGSLAFGETGVNQVFDERLGIMLGSFVSGVIGFFVIRRYCPAKNQAR